MSILPTDWLSFVWGLVIGAAGVIFVGFGSAAGADLWGWCKRRIWKEPPEPAEVSQKFSPSLYPPASCAWVPKVDVPDKEKKDWSFYPHPKTNGPCYRMAKHKGQLVREFLMVSPEARKGGSL